MSTLKAIDNALEGLTKKELIEVIRMFSKNWLTLDGLWFTLVEDKYGMDAALELDLEMWHRNAFIEARRIKKYMGIEGGGVKGVLKAFRFMSYDACMPFEYSIDGPHEAHMWVTTCRPQEGRLRAGRGEFPCKPMGMKCYGIPAGVIDPSVRTECVFCPPDPHPADVWCKWKFISHK
jgi:hypothetical protein